ncbi:nuclear transport factor 2 family protein [Rhodococcus sp. NPDC127528]|uniref:nuclear transport factor 2 family protein n=1 Tax=unclassified Rhodococcus (in: high G+C Gram-positive bacteria) TaxID=192944 RepID=UPI00363A5392
MSDFEDLAAQYIAVWNETDAGKRRAGIEALWAPHGRYVDPMAAAQGPAEIDATIGAVQQQFAGMRFRLLGPVDGHHDQARFGWQLGPAGAEDLIEGFDVVERDGSGRLVHVLGFLDKVPAA